jgi:hypothetical protein
MLFVTKKNIYVLIKQLKDFPYDQENKMFSAGSAANSSPRILRRRPDSMNSDDLEWELQPAEPEAIRRATERLFAIFKDDLDKKDCGVEENKKLQPIIKAFMAGTNMITARDETGKWDNDHAAELANEIAERWVLAKKLQRRRAGCPDKAEQKVKRGTPVLTGFRQLPDDMPIDNAPKEPPIRRRNSLGAFIKKASIKKLASKIRRSSSSASHPLLYE